MTINNPAGEQLQHTPMIAQPLSNLRDLCDFAADRCRALAEIYNRLEGRDTASLVEPPAPTTAANETFPPGLVGEFQKVEYRLRGYLQSIEALTTDIALIV